MKINDKDSERLDYFIDTAMKFIDKKSQNTYYKTEQNTPPTIGVELLNGTVLPIVDEGVFILDNEFRGFIIGIAAKYLKIMLENLNNNLFSLAERPLFEYIKYWVFLVSHNNVSAKHKNRMKVLLFAGNYKFLSKTTSNDFYQYIEKRKAYLTTDDINKLNTLEFAKYFDYVWEVLKGVINSYGKESTSFFDTVGYRALMNHQHMRIHANPLSLNEFVGNHNKSVRHRLMIAFYLRQICEYFKISDPTEYKKIVYYFGKFWNNHKLTVD